MKVIKASGLEEKFDSKKIYKTILEAGGSGKIARDIINTVKKEYHNKITTKEILDIVLRELKNHPDIRARYDLKRAIMSLGPSGFPFEQFFAEVLNHYGYETTVDNHIRGKVVIHEVDIIAKNKALNKSYMIECKYHNETGTNTKLHVSMYTYARFLDLNEKQRPEMPWLVTNTKCTKDAVGYAKGVGLKVTSWNYPHNSSLQRLIKDKKLYPITILRSVDHNTKNKLFSAKVMVAKNLLNYSVEDLMKKTNLDSKSVNKILEEVKAVCDIQ